MYKYTNKINNHAISVVIYMKLHTYNRFMMKYTLGIGFLIICWFLLCIFVLCEAVEHYQLLTMLNALVL